MAHIEKEHKFTPEGKEIIEAHRIRSQRGNEKRKQRRLKENGN
jgi:hypothetical protein